VQIKASTLTTRYPLVNTQTGVSLSKGVSLVKEMGKPKQGCSPQGAVIVVIGFIQFLTRIRRGPKFRCMIRGLDSLSGLSLDSVDLVRMSNGRRLKSGD